jgi:exosortase H (IPTLxxWG-CTERM-specific)
LKFCSTFLVLVAFCSWLTSSQSVGRPLHEHLAPLLATLSVPVLALFGRVSAAGSYLTFDGFTASIEGACDGAQPAYVYLSAVLAFPSRWRDKGWGLLIGIPAIFVINLVRIATMMLFGAYLPQWFERVHLYGWQALVITLTLAVWVFWTELFVRPGNRSTC